MYVYKRTEPNLWTVGFFYAPGGRWEPESDHDTPEKAAERVRWLNGDATALRRQVEELQTLAQEMLDYIIGLAGKCECGGPLMATSICVQCQARAALARWRGSGGEEMTT